jgi:hypothetical protein
MKIVFLIRSEPASCLLKQSVGASWTWRCDPASLKKTNVWKTTQKSLKSETLS